MNILTISENVLREILDEKFLYLDDRIELLSEQNLLLKKTIKDLLKKSNPEEILTIKEVAVFMKVRETTVRSWCRNDLIQYQKSGSTYRIKRSALDKYRNKGQF